MRWRGLGCDYANICHVVTFAVARKDTTQGLTAAAALAAAILGPITTIIIGRRQIRAMVLPTNRQTWINALREDIAELIEERIEWSELFRPHPNGRGILCKNIPCLEKRSLTLSR